MALKDIPRYARPSRCRLDDLKRRLRELAEET